MIGYYLIFLFGMVPGYFIQHSRKHRITYWAIVGCGYALIALFGLQMAAAPEIRRSLPGEVLSAALIALLAAVGSASMAFGYIWAVRRLCVPTAAAAADETTHATTTHPTSIQVWLPTGTALCLLFLGVLVGSRIPVLPLGTPINILLLSMIAAVGIQSGHEFRAYQQNRATHRPVSHGSRILFFGLPIAVMAGTLIFSAAAGLVTKLRWADCMLCAAPMGWQTLGGPMIQNLRGIHLGNVAFLTNMFRDVISLVLIPLIARKSFVLLCVTPGGVSSMDILLPGIMAVAGQQYLAYGIWVGACCSFWAPIIIYLIAKGGL